MRYLAATLLALISAQAWGNELDSLLQQVQVFGTPMAAVQRPIQDLAPANLSKKDVDSLLHQARVLGAPMAAVQRAIQISRQPIFPKKDVLAVFDISQPSAKKRFYVLDFKSGQVTAHYAAHGRDNGPNAKAIKFKGFQTDLDMVPLGPLKTAHSEVMDHLQDNCGPVRRNRLSRHDSRSTRGRHLLQQLHQPHSSVQMDHPPELVHHRCFSRQK